MSTKINIKNYNSKNLIAISIWMIEKFGPPEEGKTWFWSTTDYQEYNSITNRYEDKCQTGIEIWSQDQKNITMAVLKWA